MGGEKEDEKLDLEEGQKQIEHLRKLGEEYYDRMYDERPSGAINANYSDAKECFYDAIGLARRLGLMKEAEALGERLAHLKAVYRSQFAG